MRSLALIAAISPGPTSAQSLNGLCGHRLGRGFISYREGGEGSHGSGTEGMGRNR